MTTGFMQKAMKPNPVNIGLADKFTLGAQEKMFEPGAKAITPSKPDVPPPPTVTQPLAMPDQQAIEADKKRSIADQLQRRGRASTILTDQNDRLGG